MDDVTKSINRLSINEDGTGHSKKRKEAIKLFIEASKLERDKRISEAIGLYDKALKLDPDVELYVEYKRLADKPVTLRLVDDKKPEEPVKFEPIVPGLLEEIVRNIFSHQSDQGELLGFTDEILLSIFKWLSIMSLNSFEFASQSCKRLYILSRHPEMWDHIYRAAQAGLKCKNPIDRQMFFWSSFARYDGIYISKFDYYRPGLNQEGYHRPIHLVTYFRYLRFFGPIEGYAVLSLVTPDEPKKVLNTLGHAPARQLTSVIPWKNMFAHRKKPKTEYLKDLPSGLYVGRYCKINSAEFRLVMYDPMASTEHDVRFIMDLKQNGKGFAKHKSFTCQQYQSFHLPDLIHPDGIKTPIDVSTWSKFNFSRLKSYN